MILKGICTFIGALALLSFIFAILAYVAISVIEAVSDTQPMEEDDDDGIFDELMND